MTVRQLLNHTSGLPNFDDDLVAFFEPYRTNPAHESELGPRDVLALALERPRLFAPGEGWAYTGSNYQALGLLVEETTGGTPLREVLKRRIFDPLGLGATDLPAETWPVAGGGIVSSGRDLRRFLQELLGGELLPDDLRAEMLRTVPSDWDESDGYGLGVGEVTSLMGKASSQCGAAWGHLGFGGHTTVALTGERGERQIVVMVNGHAISHESWAALGALVWGCYCR